MLRPTTAFLDHPDVIVADTDGYDLDRGEPLSWLSSHLEAPHTVLLRREGHRRDSVEAAGSGRLHYLTMPRDRDAFVALVRELAAQLVPPS
jgi:DNA-binding NtrC family response regulator